MGCEEAVKAETSVLTPQKCQGGEGEIEAAVEKGKEYRKRSIYETEEVKVKSD